MYIVYDSLGNYIRQFDTYQQASTYKLAKGNYSWQIVNVQPSSLYY